ncbi:MAG TPA: hypothetical protein DET40_11760 [Lentisphaeria bacterium]|nr:MAG: hypothetical protein A2X45_12745 [Lentisphaerae bacterium GWF2_50_93]HCE44214.1 hypothetical protein [Lentisphaeria bacterium]
MVLHVGDESLKATTRCRKGFSCLSGDRKDMCKVETCIHGAVYFVKCPDNGYCPYKTSFGIDYCCNCPVRKELFDKFKI